MKIKTLTRDLSSKDEFPLYQEFDREEPIFQNTIYLNAVHSREGYYFNNNLSKESKFPIPSLFSSRSDEYFNRKFGSHYFYNSVIVCPIYGSLQKNSEEYSNRLFIGFLTIDSRHVGAFDKESDLNQARIIAKKLFPLIYKTSQWV